MSEIEQIEIGLKKLLTPISSSFLATVDKDQTDTVDVVSMNGNKYFGVRKIATIGQQGLLFKLKQGSFVIVSRISNSDELYVSMMSEIEEVKINCDSIIINDGEKGLVKIKELNDRLIKLEENLNRHEHPLVDLKLTPTANVSVNGIPIPVTGSVPAILQKSNVFTSDYSDYENPKIKHSK